MFLCSKVFNNIEELLSFTDILNRKMLREDASKDDGSFIYHNDFLGNPYSGYINPASDDRFIVCRLGSKRYSLKPNLHSHKFLYRGQTKFYNDCVPSLFRNRNQDYFLDEMIRCAESELLLYSHPLVRLLDHGIVIDGRKIAFEVNIYGLMQHYYNKTSLLDLTSDYNVAAFFATNQYCADTDSYKVVDNGEGVIYLYMLNRKTDFKVGQLTTIGLQVFPRSELQRGFLYRLEKGENFNDLNNLVVLRFKQHRQLSEKFNRKYNGGKSLFPDDILSHHWKTCNHPKLVSRKAVMLNANLNKKYGETFATISTKLQDRGYEIRDYTPSLTSQELHDYYYSDKNFWKRFCSKIYFPGEESESMLSQMMSAEFNPEYSWAFDENKTGEKEQNSGYLHEYYSQKCGI